jgi:hypothetical protein
MEEPRWHHRLAGAQLPGDKGAGQQEPAISAATTSRLVQPVSFPRMSAHTNPMAAPVTNPTPGISIVVPDPKLSGGAPAHEREWRSGRSGL